MRRGRGKVPDKHAGVNFLQFMCSPEGLPFCTLESVRWIVENPSFYAANLN